MKKDIPKHKVEDLIIAVVPSSESAAIWDSYVINLRNEPIRNVLVNSRGYGEIAGEAKSTTVLRHFFAEIGPEEHRLIEPLHDNLLDLTNEFWVSFTYDGYMYDKKYVFVRGSIDAEHFTEIPQLEQKGVMIR